MLLSKVNSPVASAIKDIRPIGILPTLWKAVEKFLKALMQNTSRSPLLTGTY